MCQTVTCDSVIDVFDDVYEAGTNIQDTVSLSFQNFCRLFH